MPINIHGKEYVTVAERLTQAHDLGELVSVETEVLYQTPVVVKATVTLKSGKVFSGISAANPSKTIEKMSPYEVAETSAVGRALGFAGYGAVDSIATADEVVKAEKEEEPLSEEDKEFEDLLNEPTETKTCHIHNVKMERKFSDRKKTYYWSHIDEDGKICFGH